MSWPVKLVLIGVVIGLYALSKWLYRNKGGIVEPVGLLTIDMNTGVVVKDGETVSDPTDDPEVDNRLKAVEWSCNKNTGVVHVVWDDGTCDDYKPVNTIIHLQHGNTHNRDRIEF